MNRAAKISPISSVLGKYTYCGLLHNVRNIEYSGLYISEKEILHARVSLSNSLSCEESVLWAMRVMRFDWLEQSNKTRQPEATTTACR